MGKKCGFYLQNKLFIAGQNGTGKKKRPEKCRMNIISEDDFIRGWTNVK